MTNIRTWKLAGSDFLPVDALDAFSNLDDVSLHLPQGVYTTFRTYGDRTRVLGLVDHFKRLQDSAQKSGWDGRLDADRIRKYLKQVLLSWQGNECRVRITLDLSKEPGCVYITLMTFEQPAEALYFEGVVVKYADAHRQSPEIKDTDFISKTRKLKSDADQSIYEWLIVENDLILEGISSNFFGVREGTIYTAGQGVLAGITRQTVLTLAENLNLPLILQPVATVDLVTLDEAFITSSSRGIVPVIKVAGQVIGAGKPGEITRRLRRAYDAFLNSACEPV